MSKWTQVATIIRTEPAIAAISDPKAHFTKIFGKEVSFDSDKDIWIDAANHPENYLPKGDEGSLHMTIMPDSVKNAYVINIYGDLRNHDDARKILHWFTTKCSDLELRQAVITINDYEEGSITYTFPCE